MLLVTRISSISVKLLGMVLSGLSLLNIQKYLHHKSVLCLDKMNYKPVFTLLVVCKYFQGLQCIIKHPVMFLKYLSQLLVKNKTCIVVR